MTTATATRPSVALYTRSHPLAAELLADRESPYVWGWEAAKLDAMAGFEPMTDTEMESLWHPDYTEGYFDFAMK